MNMEEDLAKLKINIKDDPKMIDDKIVAIKMRYGVPLLDKRKAAITMRAGKKVYASMLTTGMHIILLVKSQAPTAKELLSVIHRHWRISGSGNEDEREDDDSNEKSLLISVF